MRGIFSLLFLLISVFAYSQPDSARSGVKIVEPEPDISSKDPLKPKSTVIITSGATSVRGNSWNDRWLDHVENRSLKIGEQLLKKDTTKRIYQAVIQFSINEDGSLRNLQVSCSPRNAFVEQECMKIANSAPKKEPSYKNGKYVRTNIYQPISVKVNY